MGFGPSSCKILLINCLHYDLERCNYDLLSVNITVIRVYGDFAVK